MGLDEATRHALHLRLDEVLGPEHAAALMTAYPPVAWEDVATKQDLRELRLEIEAMLHREISGVTRDINGVTRDITGVSGALAGQTRSLVIAVVGAMVANTSLTIGALTLTR